MNGHDHPWLEDIRELNLAIREQVQQADLATASELAARRHRHLVALFANFPRQAEDGSLVDELYETLGNDRELMQDLAALRDRLERELGTARNSTRLTRAYLEVQPGIDS